MKFINRKFDVLDNTTEIELLHSWKNFLFLWELLTKIIKKI